jgi:uncharacterized alkaline shock family protein YloU
LELLDPDNARIAVLEKGGIDINIYVQMTYGALMPKIIPNLRSALQEKILSLAELEVRNINIYVEKIHVPDKKKAS